MNAWEINYDDISGGSNFTSDQLSGSYVTVTAIAVPEPSTLILAGLILAAAAIARRRRR